MNVALEKRWERFVDEVVSSGRYGSASDVVQEGLRLMQAQEEKLQALRATIQASIAEGGELTDEDVAASVERTLAQLAAEGY